MIEKWNGDEMKTSGKVAVSAGAGAIAGAAHGLISCKSPQPKVVSRGLFLLE